MVGGVDSSLGSSAYLKQAQLGSSAASRNKSAESSYDKKDSSPVSFLKETSEAKPSESSYESKETSSVSTSEKTELQAKNDNSTLQTEQTRGSLLDIAV